MDTACNIFRCLCSLIANIFHCLIFSNPYSKVRYPFAYAHTCSYLEKIADCLKEGGAWFNLGPLLYHYRADEFSRPPPLPSRGKHGRPAGGSSRKPARNSLSVELTYEELKAVLPRYGLRLVEERVGLRCNYCQDKDSMKKRVFDCVFFVCVKGPPAAGLDGP